MGVRFPPDLKWPLTRFNFSVPRTKPSALHHCRREKHPQGGDAVNAIVAFLVLKTAAVFSVQ